MKNRLSKSIERLNSDKNFLLDNLSTILPDEFKLDQIIGEFNIFPVSLSLNLPILNLKQLVFVGFLMIVTCWDHQNPYQNNNSNHLNFS